jgi:chromosome segregation ATPase
MPFPLWIALALIAVLLAGAGSIAAVRAARAWRTARDVSGTLTAAVTVVASRAEQASARVERLREQVEPVQRATSELEHDLDTLKLLVDELRTLQAKVTTIRAVVPTK